MPLTSGPTARGGSTEPPEAAAAVSASNAFGLDLYHHMARGTASNVFISPYSIMNALCMVAEGARKSTAEEMRHALHLPERLEEVHAVLSALNRRMTTTIDTTEASKMTKAVEIQRGKLKAILVRILRTSNRQERPAVALREGRVVNNINDLLEKSDPTVIEVANAVWVEKTCPLAKSYVSTVSDHYGDDVVQQADFRSGLEAECQRINAWVEAKTRERIQNLLLASSVDPLTRLVLTNAIYFKGEWENPFREAETHDEDFSLADGRKSKAPLMRRSVEGARYAAFNADGSYFKTPGTVPRRSDSSACYPGEDGFAMVELPYRGGKLAMVVIAPNHAGGLGAIEARMDSKTLGNWIGQLRQREVDVHLPRFKTETAYDLNQPLIAMGMKSAFLDPTVSGGANFRGMVDSEEPSEQLYIGLVRHKAFADVNEKGTEAAAATAVVASCARETISPFTPVFRADRPFLYLIRDVGTGCMLFLGRMTKP